MEENIVGYLYWMGKTQIILSVILLFQFLYQSCIIIERLLVFNRVRKNLIKLIIPDAQDVATLVDIEIIKEKTLLAKTNLLYSLRKYSNTLLSIAVTAPLISVFCFITRLYQSFHWRFGCGSETIGEFIIWFFDSSIYQLGFGVLISIISITMYFYFKHRYEFIDYKSSIISSEFLNSLLKRI